MAIRTAERPGQRMSLRLAVLPARQNSKAIPSSHEPGCSLALEEHPSGNAPARPASFRWGQFAAQQAVSALVRLGRRQAEAGYGNRRSEALGAERLTKNSGGVQTEAAKSFLFVRVVDSNLDHSA